MIQTHQQYKSLNKNVNFAVDPIFVDVPGACDLFERVHLPPDLNNTLFKFSPLMKPYDYSYQFVDGGIKKELEFNFCKKISKKCQGQQTYAGVFWQTPEQKCFSFSHPKFSSVMQEYYNI
jgi:hypothetical protein